MGQAYIHKETRYKGNISHQLRQEKGTKRGSKTNYNTTEDKIYKTKQEL